MIFASLSIPTELLASLVIAGDANDNVASRFDIQQLAVESIGNLGLMCEAFRRQRNPSIDKEDVIVDVRRAVLEFGSEKWCRVNSELPKDAWMPLSGLYECGGGRYVRMHCNFEHHKVAALKAVSRLAQTSLSNSIERTACEDLVKTLDANELEREASLVGAVIASVRARAEFVAHAQHHTLRQTRLCDLKQQTNLVDANVTASSHALAPLANIRILNLTRVLAGPVCCRALAAWGADVVRTSCHTVPEFDALLPDTSRGQSYEEVDLKSLTGRARFEELLSMTDVIVVGYQAETCRRLRIDADSIRARYPHIIHARISAWGDSGPFAGWRGFDSIVQAACGINAMEQEAFGDKRPRAMPVQALDHAAGYALATSVVAALWHRAHGATHISVHVSLWRTAEHVRRTRDVCWCEMTDVTQLIELSSSSRSLLIRDVALKAPTDDDMYEFDTHFGRVHALRHSARLRNSYTPHWKLISCTGN